MGATPRLGQQRALSKLSGVHIKVLRGYLTRTPDPLPCYRIGGKTIIVRRVDWDLWIERFRTVGRPNVDQLLKHLGLR